MTTLLDLLPPFEVGQRIRRQVASDRRTYTVTAVLDEGDQWRVEADTPKPASKHYPDLLVRCPKGEPPALEAAA
ncbi:MAG: hypothetical protein AAGE88_18335 [Actinomycetota bacterium]